MTYTIKDEIKDPDVVELSSDVAAVLLRLLPRQSSILMSGGAVTKSQLNTLLTLAINITYDSHDVDPGGKTIDHLNRDPLDNRIANLRLADMHQQNLNTRCTLPSTAVRYLGLAMSSNKNRSGRPRWSGKILIAGHYYSFGSAAVDTIDDEPPSWLVERAARIYALRDDPDITDDTLIDEINALKRVSPVATTAE